MASRSMVATDRGARMLEIRHHRTACPGQAAQAPALLASSSAARPPPRSAPPSGPPHRTWPESPAPSAPPATRGPTATPGRHPRAAGPSPRPTRPPPPIAPPGSPPSPRPRGPGASYRPPRNRRSTPGPRTPEVLDQGRHPAMRRYRRKTDLVVELEVQTISHHRNPPTLTHQVKPLESKIPRHARESFSIRNLSRGMRKRPPGANKFTARRSWARVAGSFRR